MAARNQGKVSRDRPAVDRAGREFLRQLALQDAPVVIADARAAARERAREILEDALVEELLNAVGRGDRPAAGLESTSAWWAYGIVAAGEADDAAAGLMGVEPGAAVEAVAEGDLAMLVSRVPLAEYGDAALREHLEDIAWLERTARAHEAVQQAVLDRQTLVPLRLCTIYRDLDRIHHALKENGQVFSRNLAALAGAKEWGVKVFLDPRSMTAEGAPEDAGSAGDSGDSGVAYLANRQRERDRADQADELCRTCVEDVQRAVVAVSIGERINPVQRPEAHGRDAEMILNGAYLVEDELAGELGATISRLQEHWTQQGLLVELTGPWPPYNFVSESAGMFS